MWAGSGSGKTRKRSCRIEAQLESCVNMWSEMHLGCKFGLRDPGFDFRIPSDPRGSIGSLAWVSGFATSRQGPGSSNMDPTHPQKIRGVNLRCDAHSFSGRSHKPQPHFKHSCKANVRDLSRLHIPYGVAVNYPSITDKRTLPCEGSVLKFLNLLRALDHTHTYAHEAGQTAGTSSKNSGRAVSVLVPRFGKILLDLSGV